MTHYTLRRRISLRESFLEVLRRRSVVIRPVNILYIIFNVIIAYSVNSLKVKKKINKYYKYDIFYEFHLFIFLLNNYKDYNHLYLWNWNSIRIHKDFLILINLTAKIKILLLNSKSK